MFHIQIAVRRDFCFLHRCVYVSDSFHISFSLVSLFILSAESFVIFVAA